MRRDEQPGSRTWECVFNFVMIAIVCKIAFEATSWSINSIIEKAMGESAPGALDYKV